MAQSITQNEKDLLLKDLSARLPYGIICDDGYGNILELNGIDKPNTATFKCSDKTFGTTDLDKCKPYLFPLSSITKEQEKEFNQLLELELKAISDEIDHAQVTAFEIDFYNKHHFDWRGLISIGLALDATDKNIY